MSEQQQANPVVSIITLFILASCGATMCVASTDQGGDWEAYRACTSTCEAGTFGGRTYGAANDIEVARCREECRHHVD